MVIDRQDTITKEISHDELLVFHLPSGFYYGLEGALKVVWEKLQSGPIPYETLIRDIQNEFENDKGEIQKIVNDAIEQLKEKELIKVDDQ